MSEIRYCYVCKEPIESNQSRICARIDNRAHYIHRKCDTETPRPHDSSGSECMNLLSCPFCGGKGVENTLTHTESGQTFDGVKCDACQAMTLTKQIWQNRAT